MRNDVVKQPFVDWILKLSYAYASSVEVPETDRIVKYLAIISRFSQFRRRESVETVYTPK